MSKDEGGPAFPVNWLKDVGDSGMSLRDWFAGQALMGLMSAYCDNHDQTARWAWEYADAMIVEKRRPEAEE